ncbi:MAG: glycine cleavage system aminomethyltransferase GcvT [Flavobacteriales bacterium]|nr:glycine cleavage system aminomethyltransferase GcvT [Flavobacteriales bacterium]MDW8431205.1 glycine cleavage system aminomethyltransferase GcvT [Flavobacteriales bacterium]
MKKTALHPRHLQLKARMVPFAGFEMPVSYSGITQEHMAVRQAAGIFDVSHMGEFFVEGPDALPFLEYVTTNYVAGLDVGQAQYSCMLREHGGIVDDLLVYCLGEDRYMMVVNAANIDKDFEHLREQSHRFNVNLLNASEVWSLMAVQGPKALEIVQKLTETDLSEIPYYHFDFVALNSVEEALISNTGYTGAGGFEIYVPQEVALHTWDILMEAGASAGLVPCGLGARDTLRLEKGYCLYGQDIDETTTPLEAGLSWIVKFQKDFLGKEALLQQKAQGITRKLVGLVLHEKAIPRTGYSVCDTEGKPIGRITSGAMSPVLGLPIALAYVSSDYSSPGSRLKVSVRERLAEAEVKKLPFL